MKLIYSLLFLSFAVLSYAQIESVDDANADLKEQIENLENDLDNTTVAIDSMDKIAEDLEAESNALADKIAEAEQKIEAAQNELNEEKEEPAAWGGLAKMRIVVFAVLALIWIFRKRNNNP